jgi:hypothetical protein
MALITINYSYLLKEGETFFKNNKKGKVSYHAVTQSSSEQAATPSNSLYHSSPPITQYQF